MSKRIKNIAEFLASAVYFPFVPLFYNRPRRVILFYHSVKRSDVENFDRQMAYLAKNCCVVNATDIYNPVADNDKTIVAVTFDDGFVSVLENAVPVLEKYDLPSAIFLPAGNLNQPPNWPLEETCADAAERVMSAEQIKELNSDTCRILSHTVSHTALTKLDDSRLEHELTSSKQDLEAILGCEVNAVSYPYGDYDDRVCDFARRAGYKFGFTITPAMVTESTDTMQINRFAVSARDSMTAFKLKISGAYYAVKYLRSAKRICKRV